jgi:hypothetical protein
MSDALFKELDRRSRAERRLFIRQQIVDAKRFARALKAAGVPVRSATIAGIIYEFGEPAKAALTPSNPWDDAIYENGQKRPS